MFNVFSRSRDRSQIIRQALACAGLAAATDLARVTVVRNPGQYSGRHVDFFRAFDSAHQSVLLATGHVEQEGTVVVNDRLEPADSRPMREPANRAEHADDERLVFWNGNASRVSESAQPAPASACLDAGSVDHE